MSKNLTVLLAALLFVASAATAHAQGGTLMVFGAGQKTCNTWLEDRASYPLLAENDQDYVDGYLTGTENMYSLAHNKSVSITMQPDSIFHWIDNFCLANQNTTLAAATASFWFHSGAVSVTPNAPVGNVTK